ncbi:MAG: hypothetical protein U0169_06510 [Polyangiaceae bacterium]
MATMDGAGRGRNRRGRRIAILGIALALSATACASILGLPDDPILDPDALGSDGGSGLDGASSADGTTGSDAATGHDGATSADAPSSDASSGDGAARDGGSDGTTITDASDGSVGIDVDVDARADGSDGAVVLDLDAGVVALVDPSTGLHPNALAVADEFVYFANAYSTTGNARAGTANVYRIPVRGGQAPQAVFGNVLSGPPRGFSVDADDICLTTSSSTEYSTVGCFERRTPTPTFRQISSKTTADFYKIVSDSSAVYWIDQRPGTDAPLQRKSKDLSMSTTCLFANSGPPAEVFNDLVRATDLNEADGGPLPWFVYVASSTNGILRVSAEDCETSRAEVAVFADVFNIDCVNGRCFWGDHKSAGEIRTPGTDGGAVTLASAQSEPRSLHLDGSTLYWVNEGSTGSNGEVKSCTVSSAGACSGSIRTLASGLHSPKNLYFTPSVLFVTVNAPEAQGGTVLRIRI